MTKHPLPAGLNALADAAGVDVAMQIALARGGARLQIPLNADGSILVDLVGIDAARKIVNHLAGERITIPLGHRILNTWLRDDQEKSQEYRAMKLRKGRRTIQNWDGQDRTSGAEPDLFDTVA